MPQTDRTSRQHISAKFMLVELNKLNERLMHEDTLGDKRLNLYITLSSGILGTLMVLQQIKGVPFSEILHVALLVFVLIWLLGLLTFRRLIERIIEIVDYMRAINRIRRFFVNLEKDTEKYLMQPALDNKPAFTDWSFKIGSRAICELICSFAFGALITTLYTKFFSPEITSTGVVIGISFFLLHWLLLQIYTWRLLAKKDRQYDTHFSEGS